MNMFALRDGGHHLSVSVFGFLPAFTTKLISLSENVFMFPIPKKRYQNQTYLFIRVCVSCVNVRTINKIPSI